MPDRDEAAALGEHDLVLFALVCLAAMRAVTESNSTPVRLVPEYKVSGISPKKCPTPIDGSRICAPGSRPNPSIACQIA